MPRTSATKATSILTASDFEALILVAKRHRVRAFELGEVKVSFDALAFLTEDAPQRSQGPQTPAAKKAAEKKAKEEADAELFYSSSP